MKPDSISVRPSTFFRLILTSLGMGAEVDDRCTTMNFPHSQCQGQGHGGLKVVKYGPTPDRWTPTGSKEANGRFHIN